MEYRDRFQNNRKGKTQQIAMIDPEQMQQKKKAASLFQGNDNLMDEMLGQILDEPENVYQEEQKYRQIVEAKQQKSKSTRAPKVQQSFKDIIKEGEMEIENANAKRH